MIGWLKKLLGPRLDAHEQRCVDDVREHGCHILQVFDPEGEEPDFSYSVGFVDKLGQNDIIVFGLKQELMKSMINETYKQCAAGLRLVEGLRIFGLIEDFDVIARRVTDALAIEKHFGWAIWYYRHKRMAPLGEVFQLVWPGAQQGLYPWESGCDPYVAAVQPPLYQSMAAT